MIIFAEFDEALTAFDLNQEFVIVFSAEISLTEYVYNNFYA